MRAHVIQHMYFRAGDNTLFNIEYAKKGDACRDHHIYIYIYIWREREREKTHVVYITHYTSLSLYLSLSQYTYIYIYTYIHNLLRSEVSMILGFGALNVKRWATREPRRRLRSSEGGMMRLEILIELRVINSSFSSLSFC